MSTRVVSNGVVRGYDRARRADLVLELLIAITRVVIRDLDKSRDVFENDAVKRGESWRKRIGVGNYRGLLTSKVS